MAWHKIEGVVGKVYRADTPKEEKKHPCADCFACQHCSQDRCHLCRGGQKSSRRSRPACPCTAGRGG